MKIIMDRFWVKVNRADNTEGCWNWTAALSRDGYGQLRVGNGMQLAHRVSYSNLVGLIPEEVEIDHLCRNPSCVNPYHLELVTHRINCERGDLEGNGLRALREISRKRAEKTHCKNKHSLSGENVRIRNGKRVCVQCVKDRNDKMSDDFLQKSLIKRGGKYWGVTYQPNKQLINPWIAQFCHNSKMIHLGTFISAEEAAAAYNIAREYLKPESKHKNDVPEVSINVKWIVQDKLKEKGLI